MRYWTNENTEKDGSVTVQKTPWSPDDYVQAIADLEAEITPRRLREAVLTLDGAEWLAAKNQEIESLRADLANV